VKRHTIFLKNKHVCEDTVPDKNSKIFAVCLLDFYDIKCIYEYKPKKKGDNIMATKEKIPITQLTGIRKAWRHFWNKRRLKKLSIKMGAQIRL
jgi:hypothetical protein